MTDKPSSIDPSELPFERETSWQDFKHDEPSPAASPAPSGSPPTSTRAIARQATSYQAFRGEEPASDDPLLDFTPVPHQAPHWAPHGNSITPERPRAFVPGNPLIVLRRQSSR